MILDQIVADTRLALARRKEALPESALRERVRALPPTLDLCAALRGPGVSIIAEIKRASPSRGAISPSLEPARLAADYARAGAEAISVLTEGSRFGGSLADLAEARRGLAEAGLMRPILRKDFILDSYQLLEARAWGADAALLIAAILDDAALARLYEIALALGLTPLVEVHDEEELARVLRLNPPLVGINNRNLKDLSVDLGVTRRLRPLIPPPTLVVSESGIHKPEQMRQLKALQVDAALIGEALLTAPDPAARLRQLKEAGR
ncbi:MAG: indole-3-glycerol phosphate synthase TrpC [Chloroflexi bacterium]|nr:indole-3-glycerol phosphate synthase TrpC [Chloroflexota bacterium]